MRVAETVQRQLSTPQGTVWFLGLRALLRFRGALAGRVRKTLLRRPWAARPTSRRGRFGRVRRAAWARAVLLCYVREYMAS